MSFALGPRADAPISEWDELFIPMRLRDAIRGVRVAGTSGDRPLVRSEQELNPEGPINRRRYAVFSSKSASARLQSGRVRDFEIPQTPHRVPYLARKSVI